MFNTSALSPYLAIARFNRWSINVFMLTGVFFAICVTHEAHVLLLIKIAMAFVGLCSAAFANYVINEWFDAPYDALHPDKKNRPAVKGILSGRLVALEYLGFLTFGLLLAALVSKECVLVLLCFVLAGVAYNVPPLRLKDIPYVDVLSESVNHPLRFLLGWYVVVGSSSLPLLWVASCWALGAYLMTLKRFAEFRYLGGDAKKVGRYRRSFSSYSEKRLASVCCIYAVLAVCGLSVVLLQVSSIFYWIVPFLILLVCWYSWVGCLPNSPVQHPEQLYRHQPWLMFSVTVVLLVTLGLLYVSG